MEIKVQMKQLVNNKTTKAVADVIIDNAVVIHQVRVVEGEKGNFVSMPREKWTARDGVVRYRDVVNPVSASARNEIQDAVLSAYKAYLMDSARV